MTTTDQAREAPAPPPDPPVRVAPAGEATFLERVSRYADLRDRERQLRSQQEAVREEADGMEQLLLEELAASGAQSVSVRGRTVYMHRQLWARVEEGVEREQVVAGLRRSGLEHFVSESYNSNTVSAWLRDLDREEKPLPEPLRGLLGTTEKHTLRVRRS